jgi:hypothetical protein
MTFQVPEKFRVRKGTGASTPAFGNNGFFLVTTPGSDALRCIASDGQGWEHVSVSLAHRCPTWKEMCRIKDLFWGEEDCVMQLHPPKSEYVNNHAFCLHLWRPIGVEIPSPPAAMVGDASLGTIRS